MVEGYIYKIILKRNIDSFKVGECYIGKHNGIKGNYYGSGKIIKSIIKKYGKKVFNREIICKDINNDELLSYLERYYINYYKCNRSRYNYGLNLTDGGEGIFGFKKTEKQCKALSNRIKKEYIENKRRPPTEKLLHQYNKENGKYIKTFINAVIACKEVNGNYSSSISYAARDKFSSAYGFMWSYRKMDVIDKFAGNGVPIIQYDKKNNFIKEYKSATEAARTLNLKNAPISNCLNGRSKTSYGFIWKYKNS